MTETYRLEGKPLPYKTFVELFDPVRGLMDDIDFSRNPSTARQLDLMELTADPQP